MSNFLKKNEEQEAPFKTDRPSLSLYHDIYIYIYVCVCVCVWLYVIVCINREKHMLIYVKDIKSGSSIVWSFALWVYIYIYYHPQTDCFVLSELFRVARHVGRSKPG